MAMSVPGDRRIVPHKWLWSFSNIAVESAGTVIHDPVSISFSNWPDAQHFTDTVRRVARVLIWASCLKRHGIITVPTIGHD